MWIPVLENWKFFRSSGTGDFLTFDTLTLVPVQSKLILPELLTREELDWLNEYHEKCRWVTHKKICMESLRLFKKVQCRFEEKSEYTGDALSEIPYEHIFILLRIIGHDVLKSQNRIGKGVSKFLKRAVIPEFGKQDRYSSSEREPPPPIFSAMIYASY